MKKSKPLSPEKERKKLQPRKDIKELNWWNKVKRRGFGDKEVVND